MKSFSSSLSLAFLLIAAAHPVAAQDAAVAPAGEKFNAASQSIEQRLRQAVGELNSLREKIAEEKIPLSRKLSELESKLSDVRLEYQQTARQLDSHTLDLANLGNEIKSREAEAAYLANLLSEYTRNFESRLHIAELRRYQEPLDGAKLANENSALSDQEVFAAQAALLTASIDRLDEALGGARFSGTAVDPSGRVQTGEFLLLGPASIFQSADGAIVGTVEQRLGSLEPAIVPFENPTDLEAASDLLAGSAGLFPLDPTLGGAHKIAETRESIPEHIKKGGPVMIPILALAAATALVVLFKWLGMLFIPSTSRRRIEELLAAVARRDEAAALKVASAMRGPVGRMLLTGVRHIREPRELIEEVMYEQVLATRLRLERLLPFVAIAAASAPLLGLLGTVTGIINTFSLMTVFGTGDIKTLSSGISEALITTEYGLIVAIPALLFHSFLSRKARGVINRMEKAGLAFANQLGKTPFRPDDGLDSAAPDVDPDPVPTALPVPPPPAVPSDPNAAHDQHAGSMADCEIVRIPGSLTVADALDRIRSVDGEVDIEAIYVVDAQGRFIGQVPLRRLLTHPRESTLESLVEASPVFVRVDAHHTVVRTLFGSHDLESLPVLDHDDQPVGRIPRNGFGERTPR